MSTQRTLTLPDDTYERAAQFAVYAKRDVSEIIAAAPASTLPSLDTLAHLHYGVSGLAHISLFRQLLAGLPQSHLLVPLSLPVSFP